MAKKKFGSTNISTVIRKHLNALRKPGVLTVRPGYEIRKHQLTGKQAIVATVHTKKKTPAPGEALPNSVAGVPVDVREATPYQRLRAADPDSAAIAKTYGGPELNEPVWPGELEMPSGKPLANRPAPRHLSLDAHAKKLQVLYTPAPNAFLNPVQGAMTITTAVSPDCGLATLDKFLAATKTSLVIGMYDFTSGPILSTFEKLLTPGGHQLQMVLDNPPQNPTANQSDPETVQALVKALDARFKFNWALERNDRHVSAWIFPSAYHIKVIVRDGAAVWLSSGNLNNSNEPDFDSPPKTKDRDWHVIVENQGLAETYSAYIQNDFQVASKHQAEAPDDVQSAVRRANLKMAQSANPPPTPVPLAAAPAGQVKPQTFQDAKVSVTPLLTPDSLPNGQGQYMTQMLALIKSAKKSLDIQLQYIEVPKNNAPGDLQNLLLAVKALINAGVQVRVLQSLEYGEKWAEQMLSMPNIDLTSVMKLQPNVHNKGFVVDSQTVVVSSQNWSQPGVRENRDAGMIIESAPVAQYFEKVFSADWTKTKPFNPAAAKANPQSSTRK